MEKWIKQYKLGHIRPADKELQIIRWYTPLGEVNQTIHSPDALQLSNKRNQEEKINRRDSN